MNMSGTTIGLVLGLMIGIVDAVILLRTNNAMLKAIGLASLVIAPLVGWLIGAYVLEGAI